jgi:aminopeptidase N
MVEGYVGAGSFLEGINAYLKKFAYANATGEGFWTTLASVTKKPIDRVLRSFITHASMPLVKVEARCAGNATEVSLSQRPVSPAVPSSTLWEIPICYKRERNGKVHAPACVLLSGEAQTTRLDGCSTWVLANADSRGYYRTEYGARDLRALGAAAAKGQLNLLEQTTLLEDLWTLVRLDEQSIAEYLTLSGQLISGRTNAVTSTALERINYISESLVDGPLKPAFRNWVRQAVAPLAARLGWTPQPNEPHDILTLRSDALFTIGNAGGDPAVLREARRLADLHVAGTAPLHPSVVDTALRLAAIEGDAALYDRYVTRMRSSATPGERSQYLAALSFFEDPELRKRTLAYATSAEIRTHEAPDLIGYLMRRPSASRATWAHLKDNWRTVVDEFGVFQGIPGVIGSLRHLCDIEARNDVDRFFELHQVPGTERTLEQSIETIQRCAGMKSAQAENLAEFLTR